VAIAPVHTRTSAMQRLLLRLRMEPLKYTPVLPFKSLITFHVSLAEYPVYSPSMLRWFLFGRELMGS
jgi:hypothetical protein